MVRVLFYCNVLNKVPNVVVLLGRQPVVCADLAVTLGVRSVVEVRLRQAAIEWTGRVVASNSERLELIRTRVSSHPGSDQTAETGASLGNNVGPPYARITELR